MIGSQRSSLKSLKVYIFSSFKVITAPLVRIIIQYQGPYPYIDGIILRSTRNIGRELCKHEERKTGRSNYTLGKLIYLWSNMFTGFSILPLRIASIMGLFVSVLTIFLMLFFILSSQVGGVFIKQDIPIGWASTITVITFFSGLELCVLGLIGEYLGRLLLTVNRSPQFLVRNTYGVKEPSQAD